MRNNIYGFTLGFILLFTGGIPALAEYYEENYYYEDYGYEDDTGYEENNGYDMTLEDAQDPSVQEETVSEQVPVHMQEIALEASQEETSQEETSQEETKEEKSEKKDKEKSSKKKDKKKDKKKTELVLPPAKEGDVMCDTLREAKAVAGLRLAAPKSLSGYTARGIYAHSGFVEVCYLGESGHMLSIFKSNAPIEVGAEIYQDEKAYDLDGIWLTMSGEKPIYYKASWEEDECFFVILSSEGMSDALIEEYFDEIA